MRIINVNLNGLKSAVDDGFYDWVRDQDADVVCIQNLMAKEYQLPDHVLYPEGFNAYFFDAEEDEYGGVAILTKAMPKAIMTGLAFGQCDRQGRYIQADFENVSVGSVFMPSIDAFNNKEDKLAFQQEFLSHLKKTRRKRREFIFCGSFQVAHKTIDLADWRSHQDTPGFLQEERAWLDQILGPVGFVDAFREANFGENQFTWWEDETKAKRNLDGWRVDYQICTPELRQFVVDAKIDRNNRWGLHAPTIIEYELDDEDDE